MTVHVDEPETVRQPRRSRLAARVGVAAAGLGVLAVLVWAFGPQGSDAPGGRGSPPPDTTEPAAGADVADTGLQQGTASAEFGSATRRVSGVPRGFPHSVDGAVEAYVSSLGTFVMGMAAMTDPELDSFVGDFMLTDLDFSPLARDKRAMLGFEPDGPPGGDETIFASCPPGLGAYKADKKGADAVTVRYWGPCIYGTGSPKDRAGLHVVWQWSAATMRWSDGDWRMPATPKPVPPKAPAPADLNRPDTRFAERAELLGAGWKLFEGASQAWPTTLLGEKP